MTGVSDKKLQTLLLALILVIGLIRLHRIDDPPIGYHSMKEVHYLSIARGYLDHGDFLHKRVLYSGMSEGPGYIEGLPQFQFLPLIYFGLWKLFGVKIWIARLVVILFSLAGIIMTFFVAKKLSTRKEVPLLSAFFLAILPISVFFGRNIQPDAPALFFLLLLTWFYLLWIEEFRGRYLFLFSLMTFVTAIVKGTFMIMLVPLVFLFPLRRMKHRETRIRLFSQVLWFLPGILLIAGWLAFTRITQVSEGSIFPMERLFLSKAFTAAYWKTRLPIMWKYTGENYTYIFLRIRCRSCRRGSRFTRKDVPVYNRIVPSGRDILRSYFGFRGSTQLLPDTVSSNDMLRDCGYPIGRDVYSRDLGGKTSISKIHPSSARHSGCDAFCKE